MACEPEPERPDTIPSALESIPTPAIETDTVFGQE